MTEVERADAHVSDKRGASQEVKGLRVSHTLAADFHASSYFIESRGGIVCYLQQVHTLVNRILQKGDDRGYA